MVAVQQEKNARQTVNPFIDHEVILLSYLVVSIGLVASQQAELKGSIKIAISRVRHFSCALEELKYVI